MTTQAHFVVVRSYGRYGRDYLCAWDDRWGTVCTGSKRKAMRFATKAEAEAAKRRAACALMVGADGTEFRWSLER